MPSIFDNIDNKLLPTLKDTLAESVRADFCVGYFNLRGWQQIDAEIEQFSGECIPDAQDYHSQCRLLVGMHRRPQEDVRIALMEGDDRVTQGDVPQLRRQLAEEFRQQLMLGTPTNMETSLAIQSILSGNPNQSSTKSTPYSPNTTGSPMKSWISSSTMTSNIAWAVICLGSNLERSVLP
ncbi:MAG: hypothetical protein AAF639_00920 [Chloroflexota bacterium]